MRLLAEFTVGHGDTARVIQLLQGDLTALPREYAVDLLVVSAFAYSYAPSPGTLIAALHNQGVDVGDLARSKEVDLRAEASCWLSAPIRRSDLNFDRIMCYETASRVYASAAETVGDVFRSLLSFATAEGRDLNVAMPILATGNQGESRAVMLPAILDAAVHWLALGLPIARLSIVLYDRLGVDEVRRMVELFEAFSRMVPVVSRRTNERATYDYFISYSRADERSALTLAHRLRELRPEVRVFVDRMELQPGSAWQQKIYEAIESSRYVVCLLSPDYLLSKPCQEEINIALLRHREEGSDVLRPAYLRSATLPPHLRLLQYQEVREADPALLESFARLLAGSEPISPEDDTVGSTQTSRTATVMTERMADLLQRIVDALDGRYEVEVTVRLCPTGDKPDSARSLDRT